MIASLCAGIGVAAVRSLCWHVGGVLAWDGSCREWYHAQTRKLATNDRNARSRLKIVTRRYNTPFGRAFAEWLRPSKNETRRDGRANVTNAVVNITARTGLIIAIPLLAFALLPLARATRLGEPSLALAALALAVGANAVGLLVARTLERMGPGATLLGALAGGLAVQIMLCKVLPFRLLRNATAGVRFKYRELL